ncbi:MAG: hypothetical protein V3U31_04075 [Dehalococcoidia bacterium]
MRPEVAMGKGQGQRFLNQNPFKSAKAIKRGRAARVTPPPPPRRGAGKKA